MPTTRREATPELAAVNTSKLELLQAWHRRAAPSDLTTYKMILTQCAVCATELGYPWARNTAAAARYCGAECQVQHWKEGGHDTLQKIKKAGGAEQYNANKKYAEAVSV